MPIGAARRNSSTRSTPASPPSALPRSSSRRSPRRRQRRLDRATAQPDSAYGGGAGQGGRGRPRHRGARCGPCPRHRRSSRFARQFPDRFIECGIAEMDMVSQAGGLALAGLLPVVHSFACFLTRAGERADLQQRHRADEDRLCRLAGGAAAGRAGTLAPGGSRHRRACRHPRADDVRAELRGRGRAAPRALPLAHRREAPISASFRSRWRSRSPFPRIGTRRQGRASFSGTAAMASWSATGRFCSPKPGTPRRNWRRRAGPTSPWSICRGSTAVDADWLSRHGSQSSCHHARQPL